MIESDITLIDPRGHAPRSVGAAERADRSTGRAQSCVASYRCRCPSTGIDIEALARAAEAAAGGLPAPTTDRQRLAFGRIQSLATKTSQQASASLRFANAQVAALTAQMEAHRKATTR